MFFHYNAGNLYVVFPYIDVKMFDIHFRIIMVVNLYTKKV